MYDWVIADIAASTQAAVAAAPTAESEPRGHGEHRADHRGRSADRPPAVQLAVGQLGTGSQAQGGRGLLTRCCTVSDVGTALGVQESERGKAIAHFAVGGVAQAISAWLAGDVDLDADQLVDQLAAILDSLDRPQAVRRLSGPR